MSGEILNQKILKERLARDNTMQSNEERCPLYQTLFIQDDSLALINRSTTNSIHKVVSALV